MGGLLFIFDTPTRLQEPDPGGEFPGKDVAATPGLLINVFPWVVLTSPAKGAFFTRAPWRGTLTFAVSLSCGALGGTC